MSKAVKVTIQICSNCKSHQWCTRHNQSNYSSLAMQIEKAIKSNDSSVDVEIFQVEGQKMGSFQISCNGHLLFSKLNLGYFPYVPSATARIIAFIDDFRKGKDLKKYSQGKNISPQKNLQGASSTVFSPNTNKSPAKRIKYNPDYKQKEPEATPNVVTQKKQINQQKKPAVHKPLEKHEQKNTIQNKTVKHQQHKQVKKAQQKHTEHKQIKKQEKHEQKKSEHQEPKKNQQKPIQHEKKNKKQDKKQQEVKQQQVKQQNHQAHPKKQQKNLEQHKQEPKKQNKTQQTKKQSKKQTGHQQPKKQIKHQDQSKNQQHKNIDIKFQENKKAEHQNQTKKQQDKNDAQFIIEQKKSDPVPPPTNQHANAKTTQNHQHPKVQKAHEPAHQEAKKDQHNATQQKREEQYEQDFEANDSSVVKPTAA